MIKILAVVLAVVAISSAYADFTPELILETETALNNCPPSICRIS
ncbi:hypothetical protein [Zooshikella ganghwensis]|nr:hypothetical protein [Zooshikella ganghwensis]